MKTELFTVHARALIVIFRDPGITVKETADRLNVAPKVFSKVKKDLINDGLITEKREGRFVRLYLTEKGEKVVRALMCRVRELDK